MKISISKEIKIIGIAGVCGYMIATYKSPLKEVTNGLYDKGKSVIEEPVHKFYDWATNTNGVENIIQKSSNQLASAQGDCKTNQSENMEYKMSELETNIVNTIEESTRPFESEKTNRLVYLKSTYQKIKNLVNEGKIEESKELGYKLQKEIEATKEVAEGGN